MNDANDMHKRMVRRPWKSGYIIRIWKQKVEAVLIACQEREISQYDLAELAGLHRNIITKWQRGAIPRKPGWDAVQKVLETLPIRKRIEQLRLPSVDELALQKMTSDRLAAIQEVTRQQTMQVVDPDAADLLAAQQALAKPGAKDVLIELIVDNLKARSITDVAQVLAQVLEKS